MDHLFFRLYFLRSNMGFIYMQMCSVVFVCLFKGIELLSKKSSAVKRCSISQ